MKFVCAASLMLTVAAAATAQDVAPLNAMLSRGVGETSFHVNQPAYVAVFEFLPGHEVRQLFPRTRAEAARLVEPGQHVLPRALDGVARSPLMVISEQQTDLRGRVTRTFRVNSRAAGWDVPPTRSLLVVASRRPLRQVASPAEARVWLHQATGFRSSSITTHAPESMVDAIIEAVIPAGVAADDQSSDVLELDTPSIAQTNPLAGQRITLNCPAGPVSVAADALVEMGSYRCSDWPASKRPLQPGSAFEGASGNATSTATSTAVRPPVLARDKASQGTGPTPTTPPPSKP